MWILGNFRKDFIFLILPALLALGIFFGGVFQNETLLFLGFVVFSWIDGGHVFITAFRTYFNAEERSSNSIYLWSPLVIFVVLVCWFMVGGFLIWDFIVYSTLHHNIRQFYGITRWYQKNIKSKDIWQTRFLYALTILPVIVYHFRDNVPDGLYYGRTHVLYFPHAVLYNLSLIIYLSLVMVWLIYELVQLRKSSQHWGVVISVAVPALSYGVGFVIGQNVFQILAPIIVAHGVAYWALTSLSMERTRQDLYSSLSKALILTVLFALFCGGIFDTIEESYIQQYFVNTDWSWHRGLISLVLAFVFTPLLLHFYLDAFLWNHRHREAALVFQTKSS